MGIKGEIIIKNDQESALIDLVRAVKKARSDGTVVENSRARDSRSNGRAERGVQSVEGMTRTMKLALEKRLGVSVPCNHPVMTWMVEHAAETLSRFQVSFDGRTAYERIKGKKYRGEIIEFGRNVYHRHPGNTQGGSMQRRWEEGIWLGKRVASDEHIIASASGKLVKTGSISMQPESESWNADAVLAVKAVPWAPDGVLEDDEDVLPGAVPAPDVEDVIDMAHREDVEGLPEPGGRKPQPREMVVREEYLDRYGFTDFNRHRIRCPKCIGMQQKDHTAIRKAHTPACRARIRECMEADERYAGEHQEAGG